MGPSPRPFELKTNLWFARDNGPKLLVRSDFLSAVLSESQKVASRMGPSPRPFELKTNLRFARDNGPKLLVRSDFCRLC